MENHVDLYDSHYGSLDKEVRLAVRAETYGGEDLGQTSWMTAAEAREFFSRLELGPGRSVLEVGCGSGGLARFLARETGTTVLGIDINESGIRAAVEASKREGLEKVVRFEVLDAGAGLPLPDAQFDAIFCNDSINHLPGRADILKDWFRILRSGGRLLYTDPIVVTGQLSNEEIRTRSSIGFFLFTPPGLNEQLLEDAGFELLDVVDVTESVAEVSNRWHNARAKREARLVGIEGRAEYDGLQGFLSVVHRLASERRLSRYLYLGKKP